MSVAEVTPRQMATPLEFEALEECSRHWTLNSEDRHISLKKAALLAPDTRVFTLGSCFAEEVKLRLRQDGYATSPNYPREFDDDRIRASRIEYGHTNHYHSYAILQEIEKALGLWKQDDDDYW